jgi:hypothetical protein
MLYVRGIRTRATTIVTWCSLVFMVVFWSWSYLSGGWQPQPTPMPPTKSSTLPD